MSLPGTRLRTLAMHVCSEKTIKRLIDPVIADLQAEYALASDTRRRCLARLTGYIAFAKVSLWCGLLGLREAHRNWGDEDRHGLFHTLWLSACAIVVVSMPLWLLELPRTRELLETARDAGLSTSASVQRPMIYLLPSILPLSIPLGLAIGTALAAHGRTLSRRLVAAVMLTALAVGTASLGTIGWITPRSNQAFREAIAGPRVSRGDREMTLIELRRLLAAEGSESARRASFEFHQRVSVSLAPVVFTAFGLVVAIRRRLRPLGALGAIGIVAVGYWIAMFGAQYVSRTAVLPTYLAPWTPPAALILTTLLVALPKGRPKAASTLS